jgi:Cu-processing system ATP-binding protein
MTAAIEIVEVSKRYGHLLALDAVSVSLPQGRVIGLLGHNGAGKSTLIKLSLGLIAPTAGRVSVLGHGIDRDRGYGFRSRIGYLPENANFYGQLSGRELLRYLGALKRVASRQQDALLERVGLAVAADRPTRTYSKGMRQRLGLAQALLGNPELLLFDEPTSGLDPIATAEFFGLVAELRDKGRTVVICSHLLGELEPHLDSAVILSRGRLLAQGSIDALAVDAGLPVTFRVCIDGGPDAAEVRALAGRFGTASMESAGDVVTFDVPPEQRMPVLRELARMRGACDIEVRKPTLARLYQSMGERIAGERGGSVEQAA